MQQEPVISNENRLHALTGSGSCQVTQGILRWRSAARKTQLRRGFHSPGAKASVAGYNAQKQTDGGARTRAGTNSYQDTLVYGHVYNLWACKAKRTAMQTLGFAFFLSAKMGLSHLKYVFTVTLPKSRLKAIGLFQRLLRRYDL